MGGVGGPGLGDGGGGVLVMARGGGDSRASHPRSS